MRSFALMLGIAGAVAVAAAQETPRFEAVSIKSNNSNSLGRMPTYPPGRVSLVNVPADFVVEFAFGVRGDRIVGLPEWAQNDRYDVIATFPRETPRAQQQQMMQAVLAERFALKAHRETREFQVWALVKARADGLLGPGIRPSTVDCKVTRCGARFGAGIVDVTGFEWNAIALHRQIGVGDRPVLDQTGITGRYDVKLEWLPDPALASSKESAALAAAGAAEPGQKVTVFTALQEQLGLRLESSTAPLDVLVIDSISPPTPN